MESDFFQIYFFVYYLCVNNDMQFMPKKKNDHNENQHGVKARESGI